MDSFKFIVVLTCLSTHVSFAASYDEDNNEGFFSKYLTKIVPRGIQAALHDTWDKYFPPDNKDADATYDYYILGDIADYLQDAFSQGGVTAAKALMSERLDEWKESRINIGITGDSGTGKSSLINALRGLTADDEGAAPVGVVETTMKPESYKHPKNPQMLLWDLPGVGTPLFTRENYFDKIQLQYYDYFIIVTSSRFTDNDKWLVNELKKRNKIFYFVRTKISFDIENDKKSHPKTHNQQNVYNTIRNDIKNNLNGLANNVYLIDNYDTDKHDFNMLSYKLVVDAPELKQEAMLFTLNIFSEDMIKEKKKALNSRIQTISITSGIFGAIPIPGLDVAVDVGILLEEVQFYKDQFGLKDEDIAKFAENMGIPVDKLASDLDLKSKTIQCTKKGIVAYMIKIGARKMAKNVSTKMLKFVLPGFGSIACAAASYYTCSNTLESLLDIISEDALKIVRYKFE